MRSVLACAFVALPAVALAGDYVHGYTRSDGTYVQPYYRSSPNTTLLDNYSTKGNVNPHTGQAGTVDPYYRAPAPGSGYGINYLGDYGRRR